MIYTLTLNPAVDLEYSVSTLVINEVLRSPVARKDFGGKGFNVSRMLNVLGVESVALGFVGGRNGRMLQEGLHSLGISTDFVLTAGETRANVSIVGQQDGDHIKVNEPGPTISDEEKNMLLKKVRELASDGDWWVLAGSLPPGIPADIYIELIEMIQAGGAKVILDTSGAALKHSLRAKPFLVKPNHIEAGELTGLPTSTPAEIVEAAQAIMALGAENVAISLGKHGAIIVTSECQYLGHPVSIKEHNPIGAGDAMVAGLVYQLSVAAPVVDALRWGLACGASAASQAGTEMGNKQLIEHFVSEIQIEEDFYAR